MNDIIDTIGSSVIQHGKTSNRVYLMKLSKKDFPHIMSEINKLAAENGYTKIFAKVPAFAKESFRADGYKEEAYIPGFYRGKEDAFFMARYFDPRRACFSDAASVEKVIQTAKNAAPVQAEVLTPEGVFNYRPLNEKDIPDMAAVYKKVFETYPFPIHNPDYLAATMKDNVVYFGVWDQNSLIAVSSCEMDIQSKNVEMTDFATHPDYRGRGLASFLLMKMEDEMRRIGVLTAYTIARATSYGMNITFGKHKYIYSGTLINNTNISGGIESMNIWYKTL